MHSPLYRHGYTRDQAPYHLLPFRFIQLAKDCLCLVNDVGDYCFLNPDQLSQLVHKRLDAGSEIYQNLRTKHFLVDDKTQLLLDSWVIKYRTKKSFLDGFTKLHMIVPTLRCNHSCPYCQVSRVSEDKQQYDMTTETAHATVDLILKSSATAITVEFQGGEPLLNFPIIKLVVQRMATERDKCGKQIDFVVATNLSILTTEILTFFKDYKVDVSTSLDGPAFIHDSNRPKVGNDSHSILLENLERTRSVLGMQAVAALMTTTRLSLDYPREIVDEYLRLGFKSIFLRPLNPYGFAVKTQQQIGYSIEEFIAFYKKAFEYILDLNKGGVDFQEVFAKMLLTKMLSPFATGYVDCQSPSGAGIGAVLYNYDGNVYPADEARMLAETGDKVFCMGNVMTHTHEQLFSGDVMKRLSAVSCNENLSGCAQCAFQPYCGSDPINNYATQGNVLGQRYSSFRCKKHLAITSYLLSYLRAKDPEVMNIFLTWITDGTVRHMEQPVNV